MLDNVSGLAARDSAEIGDNKVVGGSIVENRERRGRVCNKGRTSADLMHNAHTRRTSFLCTTLSARAVQQRRLVGCVTPWKLTVQWSGANWLRRRRRQTRRPVQITATNNKCTLWSSAKQSANQTVDRRDCKYTGWL